jgi:hypothetical protein
MNDRKINSDQLTLALTQEQAGQQRQRQQQQQRDYSWHSDRITDSGPILRIDLNNGTHLSKAERYGHPYERPIFPSLISEQEIAMMVVSYFSHAYSFYSSKKEGPTIHGKEAESEAKKSQGGEILDWSDLHEFNESIDWAAWMPPIVL